MEYDNFRLNNINLEKDNDWKEIFKIYLWWKKIGKKNEYIVYTWNNYFTKKYLKDIKKIINLKSVFQKNWNIWKKYINICLYKTNLYWWNNIKYKYWISNSDWNKLSYYKKLSIIWKMKIKNWETIDIMDNMNSTWINEIIKERWISKSFAYKNCDYIIIFYWDFKKYFWVQEKTFFHEFWHVIQYYLYNNNQYYRENIFPKLTKLYKKSIKAYNDDLLSEKNDRKKYVVRKYSLKNIEEDWATIFETFIMNNKQKFYNSKNNVFKEKLNIISNYINK